MSLEEKIKSLCTKHKISIKKLAAEIMMSDANLYKCFKRESIETKHLEKIASYFGVPVGYFFDEVGEPMGGHVQNANGKNIIQSIGEMQCRQELAAANKKIMELQDKVIRLQEKINK